MIRRAGVIVCGMVGAVGMMLGCGRDLLLPLDAEPVYRAAGVVVEDGTLTASFEIENPGTRSIRFRVHLGCHGFFIAELFADGDQAGPPMWSEAELPLPTGGCKFPPRLSDLAPGEIIRIDDEFAVDVILGDSIPPGTYEVRATVRQREPVVRDIVLTVGDAEFGS